MNSKELYMCMEVLKTLEHSWRDALPGGEQAYGAKGDRSGNISII
jgi:hypothetical protein